MRQFPGFSPVLLPSWLARYRRNLPIRFTGYRILSGEVRGLIK